MSTVGSFSRATTLAIALAALGACSSRSATEERADTASHLSTSASATAAEPHPAIDLPARDTPASHLVVLLHGVGADAASFQSMGRALAPALPRAEMLVPDGFHPFDGGSRGRQWFSLRGVDQASRAMRVRDAGAEVSRWIDRELDDRHLGRDKLVVVGFSQGAMMAAWLGTHRTPRPAAVVVLSGLVAEDQSPVGTGAAVPVFIGHGDRDARIEVSTVEASASSLEAWGARVTKHIYPGMAHEIDEREIADVKDFLSTTLAGP